MKHGQKKTLNSSEVWRFNHTYFPLRMK